MILNQITNKEPGTQNQRFHYRPTDLLDSIPIVQLMHRSPIVARAIIRAESMKHRNIR